MKKEWKRRLEEMELQLALGKAEGRIAFEEQKVKMKHYVSEAREQLSELKALGEKQRNKWQARLEDAELQLALGRAEGKDAYFEQQMQIEEALKALQESIREGKSEGDEKLDNWRKELVHNLQLFRLRMEVYKVHFALGKSEAENKFEEYRKELKEKISAAREQLDEWKEDSEERWEEFSDDMKLVAGQVERAVKKLFAQS